MRWMNQRKCRRKTTRKERAYLNEDDDGEIRDDLEGTKSFPPDQEEAGEVEEDIHLDAECQTIENKQISNNSVSLNQSLDVSFPKQSSGRENR
jgi:type I restriction-modification system DNA methylase subunit